MQESFCLLSRQVLSKNHPLWLTQWPYGFCCPQVGPGAGLQTDQSGNHAPPTEINTHFLSSLSHWFFPHSSNPHAVARPAQRKWQTTSRGSPLLWQECLRQPSGERETFSHSSGGCKLFVCLLQMLAEAAQHIHIKMVSHSFWAMHNLHSPYSHQMLQRNAIKPVPILSVFLYCSQL